MSLAYEQKAAEGLEMLGLTTAREQLDATAQTAAAALYCASPRYFVGTGLVQG